MKIFPIHEKALNSENREHILGFQETGSHACYMVYGILRPSEKGRLLNPGEGHEETILAAKGDFAVSGHYSFSLKEGTAFLLQGDQECFLENKGKTDAIYVIAGGHSETGHH
jgi:hypothetical protein